MKEKWLVKLPNNTYYTFEASRGQIPYSATIRFHMMYNITTQTMIKCRDFHGTIQPGNFEHFLETVVDKL